MGQGNAKVGRLKYKDLDGNGVIDGRIEQYWEVLFLKLPLV